MARRQTEQAPRVVRVRVRTQPWVEPWISAGMPVAALCAASLARAQDADQDRAQSFQAVKGAVKEDVPGGPLLVAAYAAIWVVVLLYVIRLVRQQQRAQVELDRLERVLSKVEGPR
jgi:CcmD family protein